MKLAGLTWWRNNYGSILQAYALQQKLNSLDNIDYEIICQYGKKIASIDNFKDKLKKIGLKQSLKRAFWKFGIKGLRLRNQSIQRFVDDNLRVSSNQYSEETIKDANNFYDGFVCGSDQIWNADLVSVDSMYWLSFANEDKLKISYAPSIGINSVTQQQADTIKKNLKSFKSISCREESGTKLINSILNSNECVTVLDPTLLVNRNVWDNICSPKKFDEKYIFVYMLRGNKKQRQVIERFAKSKGLKIVTVPFLDSEKIEFYDFTFGNIKLWEFSPSDFISSIRYADYVFTDSFHCMVFSCLYHKEFFTFPKIGKSQLNRIIDLQELFNIPSRMIDENTENKTILDFSNIDWNIVDEILNEKRLVSNKYLEKSLNIN